ncbi:MAG: hypothetical protein R3E57_04035 [Porticoccaceae bacterium]
MAPLTSNGDVVIKANGKLLKPKRLPDSVQARYIDRVVGLYHNLQNGADLLWIKKPHVGQIADGASAKWFRMPSWFSRLQLDPVRQQVFDVARKDVSADRANLMTKSTMPLNWLWLLMSVSAPSGLMLLAKRYLHHLIICRLTCALSTAGRLLADRASGLREGVQRRKFQSIVR